ncbi:transcriptional regulator, AraC family with amidase-like domain [Ruegeria halocynthiae]|uniref:Transcriptional regulator, AraC family with amidase-like domain n=1 Tax=Ruegeria halocynthiae TaxID=985054 RepID=A0A1H3E7D7_9RHOB|nr:GlxA family transcriptional regulator [Ruegeria halocynthiae]SDX74682.1 transcriptional regulator, AraC family with amidase-like domain [Ruegeria halocynthiae]
MTQTYNFLLFDGFSNLCLANMVEPLRAANTLAGQHLYAWQFYSPDGAPVKSSSGLQVAPHGAMGAATGDALIVMPSYGFLEHSVSETLRALRRAASRHSRLAGLDTGSWLLAGAGLLEGHCATIHWDEISRFEEAFPDVEVVQERFVIDRNRITCSGAMAAYDLATALILADHGPLLSMEVAHLLMNRGEPSAASPRMKSEDRLVNRVLAVMQNTLDAPLFIKEIARQLGCSQKTIETRVLAELGITPQALYRRLRLILARKLAIETQQSVAEIASRCGYENPSAMTRAFRAQFGQTPTAYRSKN